MLRRKTLAFLLSAAMIAGLVPATVMAEETEETSLPEETVEAVEAVDEEAPEESLEPEEVVIQADSEEYADPDTVDTGMTFENGVLTLAGTVTRGTLNDFLTSQGLDDMFVKKLLIKSFDHFFVCHDIRLLFFHIQGKTGDGSLSCGS